MMVWSLQVILEKQRFASVVGAEVECSWKDGGAAELFQRLVFQCTSFQVSLLRASVIATCAC